MKRTLRKNETVDDLKKSTKGEPYLVADNLIANLFIKVGAKSKHFIMSARFGDSKHPTRRTIGNASLMSLEEAREIATKWNGLNRQNIDPVRHLQTEETEKKRKDRLTFRCALEDYICWLPEREKNRKAFRDQRSLRTEFLDPERNPFLEKAVSQVSGADVQSLIENIVSRGAPGQAYTMFSSLKTFFNWLLAPRQSEHYGIKYSPCAALKLKHMKIRKKKKERSHSSKEIRAYWAAAEEMPVPWEEFFKVLLLCGQRENETAQAVWPEFDWSRKIWTIPEERFKSGRNQLVPLSAPVIQILLDIRSGQSPDHGPYVFSTTDGRKPITAFSRTTSKFRALMRKKYAELYPRDPPVPHWTIHDVRRTVRTGLSNLGVPAEVAEAVIGHEKKELEKTYNTSKFKSQRRRALYLWAEEVKRILEDPLYDHEDEDGEVTDWPSRWNAAVAGNSVP